MKLRVRLSKIMAVVAVIGVLLGGETMRRRRASCLKEAASWLELEDWARKDAEFSESRAKECRKWGQEFERRARLDYTDASPEFRNKLVKDYSYWAIKDLSDAVAYARSAEQQRVSAGYYRIVSLKYQRSARHPWLSVGPLPAEPPGAWHPDD